MKKYKWGILAPGNIATKFTTALQEVARAELYTVASRSEERAKEFAQKFGFTKSSTNFQAMLDDPEVDAIYIASPHTLHAEQAIACLSAGKPVLCEKPMSVNAKDAQSVFDLAKVKETFYMEAVWTRFMPIYKQVREWLNSGAIGDVKIINASLGFRFVGHKPVDGRLFNPTLAGGALLDIGIYPITLAQWVMQQTPNNISAKGVIGTTGVDEQNVVTLSYSTGAFASLNSTIAAATTPDAWIYGSKGHIKIPSFWCAESAILTTDKGSETVNAPHLVNGYEWEAEEVHRCLDAGLLESPVMSWNESLSVMKIMDEVRSQIGLAYPFEK